ncbi:MAG: endolytic transglycosylase MltG [Lachnospiraceae bacterium]|nr:endolytic transglycosylase MltG [Lachnospiraceae bacterium]MBR2276008.1 endolytic transglycosylase MltG [Lachnospiraceae bacterium]
MNVRQIALSFASLVIRLALVVIIVFAIIRFGKQAYEFGYKLFAVESVDEPPGRDIVVSVGPEDGMTDIAKMLEEKGLTGDWKLFFLQSKLSEYKEDIVPGTYTLNTSMNVDKMLMTLENIEDEDAEEDQGEADELTEQAIEEGASGDDNFDIYGYNGDGSEGELIEPEIVEDVEAEGE